MGAIMLATLFVAVAAAQQLAAASPAADPPKPFELVVIHTNDMHSRYEQTNRYSSRCNKAEAAAGNCFGGFARVASRIKRARQEALQGRAPPAIALNAGDTFQGSIYYNLFKWHMATTFINMLDFDALSLGNHEFDDGLDGLLPFVQQVRSPILAANLDLSDAPEMRPHVKPSVVLDVNGTRVGIIGYLTPETATLGKPSRARFVDEIPALTAEAERLHRDGVGIIIALGHSGYPMDKLIAAQVPHVDLVVGGHTHSFLYTGDTPDVDSPVGPYPTWVRQASGREVPVVQASCYTKYVGELRIRFDEAGEIETRTDVQGAPVLVDKSTPQDPDVERELAVWRQRLNGAVLEPLARSLVFLNGTCRARECNLGNLVSDALVYYRAVRYQGPGWTDAPIGIQNGGNIRASIDSSGNVTMMDVMEACPFENYLEVVYLRGDALLQMLEHSVSEYDLSGEFEKGGFLQLSGLRVTYDVTAPPGRRVVSARARCGNCSVPAYHDVDHRATYGVVTNNFLVDGGDGFSMLKDSPSLALADITPYSAMAEYLRAHRVVFPTVEGRITFVQRWPSSAAPPAPAAHTSLIASLFVVLRFALNR